MTVTLPSGEVCKGSWTAVSQSSTGLTDLASTWDTVYGQGFYTAHVLGTRLRARGSLTGNKGTSLEIELYRPDTTDGAYDISGVGKDNNGNIYKVTF